MTSVAFQGELGAFSELAARQHFGKPRVLPCRDFEGVAALLSSGAADYAVLPVENSIVGPVSGTQEIVQRDGFNIIAELWLAVHHCVMGAPETSLADVRSVLSHPIALAQCTAFFRAHPALQPLEWYDTAGAAKHVARAGDVSLAAIAAQPAAERYGLIILAENVEDRADNQTRFLILARP